MSNQDALQNSNKTVLYVIQFFFEFYLVGKPVLSRIDDALNLVSQSDISVEIIIVRLVPSSKH